MTAGRSIDREIAAQRKVIRALKKDIFGIDKTWRSSYIREFNAGLLSYRKICRRGEVLDRAAASDIVYFGDYHPLDASQQLALDILAELKARGVKVVLALEALYEYQQETLDRWMKGKLSEERFLEAIDYRSEWGFSWKSYRRFFEAARDPFVPIFGIDYEPRDELRFIRGRDRLIAHKIASIRSFFPGHTILVVIGESHTAPSHLPRQVRKLIGGRIRETVIVQNADEIYWDLLKKGRQDAEAVRIAAGSYCVFTASPMLKYQAYLRIIDQWSEGAECDIHTPTMEEMCENLLNFLVGGRGRLEVTMGEDWREPVESVMPEVDCGTTYKAISSRLRAMGMSQRGVLAASESLRRSGMVYIPLINGLEIQRFDPACAAREAARFVIYAMREEIGPARKIRRTMEDRFYSFVFEEALCAFGARIIDPVIDCDGPVPLLQALRKGGAVGEALPGMTLADTGKTVSLLRYHIARERSGGGMATDRMRSLYRLGIRKRLWVIRALGWLLGEAMYRGFHEGRVSHEELRGLFRERFDREGSALPMYLEWVRRLEPW